MEDDKEKYAYMVRELGGIIQILQESQEKYRNLYIQSVCADEDEEAAMDKVGE